MGCTRPQLAVVSKDDFAQAVWRGTPMSDESLARSISRVLRGHPDYTPAAVALAEA